MQSPRLLRFENAKLGGIMLRGVSTQSYLMLLFVQKKKTPFQCVRSNVCAMPRVSMRPSMHTIICIILNQPRKPCGILLPSLRLRHFQGSTASRRTQGRLTTSLSRARLWAYHMLSLAPFRRGHYPFVGPTSTSNALRRTSLLHRPLINPS